MNKLQIERLVKKDLKTKNIFKKVCALDEVGKTYFSFCLRHQLGPE